jgi:hypothetical protein
VKDLLLGKGDYAESLGSEVLVIAGKTEDEQVNGAKFSFYSADKHDGPAAEITGNSIPADPATMHTADEGLYTKTKLETHNGAPAIRLVDGTVRATDGDQMTGVLVHRGNPYGTGRFDSGRTHDDKVPRPWSRGCPTYGYGANLDRLQQEFGKHFSVRTNVYLRRYW